MPTPQRVQAPGLTDANAPKPQRIQGPGLIDEEAFQAAGTPGRGSLVGDFVPGKNGGWVPRDHPDASTNKGGPGSTTPTPTPHTMPAGGVGANTAEAGPAAAAMAGLGAAAGGGYGGGGGGGLGVAELAPQGASNPNLGQRIYPMAMRQLSMLPRIY